MKAWIAHKQHIRRFNWVITALFVVGAAAACLFGGLKVMATFCVVGLVGGGLFIGLANVALLLGTPSINATDEEIREAAATGPKWLKRLVVKLDAQP